jgi:hypothetical protein
MDEPAFARISGRYHSILAGGDGDQPHRTRNRPGPTKAILAPASGVNNAFTLLAQHGGSGQTAQAKDNK